MRVAVQPAVGHGYPRPQFQRREWVSLNGEWDFAIDAVGELTRPADVHFNRTITVPFSPEAPASGVGDTTLFRSCWYRRAFTLPPWPPGHRLLLHFGAVDFRATVWVNECQAVSHQGGYTPFYADITDLVDPAGRAVVIVRAEDDPHDLAKPRGKQDWQLNPHSIWYPRTSGIWQTVWLETVPATHLSKVRWTPNLERWELGCALWLHGPRRADLRLRVALSARGDLLADDEYRVIGDEVHRRIALSDPGIDDYRNELLWNPSHPQLIQADLRLVTDQGEVVDEVKSYTALRSVTLEGDHIVLNGRPYPLRLVLDQGYWPATGLTPPDDEALVKDVTLAKAMGFNGVRKHQKIEDPRYLYWADHLGLLVWEEMPSCYRFTHDSIERASREWTAAIIRDYSHPCIVAWVPFNESWGVPNLPMNPAERHYVSALYHLTRTLDATRPVVGNDGWESVATDIIGIHDYDADPDRLARRYHGHDVSPQFFKRERPAGRVLVLDGDRNVNQPVMLTEFGGIACSPDESGTWGYSRARSSEMLAERYAALLAAVHSVALFAGFCYTQFADTYQEANGLLYADRTPKVALARLFRITTGAASGAEQTATDAGSTPRTDLSDDPTPQPQAAPDPAGPQ